MCLSFLPSTGSSSAQLGLIGIPRHSRATDEANGMQIQCHCVAFTPIRPHISRPACVEHTSTSSASPHPSTCQARLRAPRGRRPEEPVLYFQSALISFQFISFQFISLQFIEKALRGSSIKRKSRSSRVSSISKDSSTSQRRLKHAKGKRRYS